MTEVVRLSDRAPVACSDKPDLIAWLRAWADGLESGDYGDFRSLVLVVETTDGVLATLSQSIGCMDRLRLVGMLHTAAHRRLDGDARVEDLRDEA